MTVSIHDLPCGDRSLGCSQLPGSCRSVGLVGRPCPAAASFPSLAGWLSSPLCAGNWLMEVTSEVTLE